MSDQNDERTTQQPSESNRPASGSETSTAAPEATKVIRLEPTSKTPEPQGAGPTASKAPEQPASPTAAEQRPKPSRPAGTRPAGPVPGLWAAARRAAAARKSPVAQSPVARPQQPPASEAKLADPATTTPAQPPAPGEPEKTPAPGKAADKPQAPEQPAQQPQTPPQPAETPQTAAQRAGTPQAVAQPQETPQTAVQPAGTPQAVAQPQETPQTAVQPAGTPQAAGKAPTPAQPVGTPPAPDSARGSEDLTESIPRVTSADASATAKPGEAVAGKPTSEKSAQQPQRPAVESKQPVPQQQSPSPSELDTTRISREKTQPITDKPESVQNKVYDPETIRIPKVSNPSDANTTALPVTPPAPEQPTPAQSPAQKPEQPIPAHPAKTAASHGDAQTKAAPPATPQRRAPGDDYPTVVVRPKPLTPPDATKPATSPADEFPTVVTQPVPMTRGVGSPADYPTVVTQRPIFGPQRVTARPQPDWTAMRTTPTGRGRLVVLALAAAAVIVLLVVAATVAIVHQIQSNSPQAQVRRAVGAYTSALATGDLGNLRDTTCGQLHDFYQNIAADQFDNVHKLSLDQKKIPKVASVDSVQINGDKATAMAGIYTDADPDHHLARTFDLERGPNGWKVCDPPSPAR